jgi:calmodulin
VLSHPWVAGNAASDDRIDRSVLASLLSFTAKNKFKKQALQLAASALTANDVAHLRAAFMSIDVDNSGFITFAELSAELEKLEMRDAERISQAMKEMDADGDGQISYDEFITAVVDRQLVRHQNTRVAPRARAAGECGRRAAPPRPRHATPRTLTRSPARSALGSIWFAFCEYDVDGDGKITREELSHALAAHGEPPERVEAYIREFDLDGDGSINYEEFMRMLLPKDVKVRARGSGERESASRVPRAARLDGPDEPLPSRPAPPRPRRPRSHRAAPATQFRVKHELEVSESRARADADAAAERLSEAAAAEAAAKAAADAAEAAAEASAAAAGVPLDLENN